MFSKLAWSFMPQRHLSKPLSLHLNPQPWTWNLHGEGPGVHIFNKPSQVMLSTSDKELQKHRFQTWVNVRIKGELVKMQIFLSCSQRYWKKPSGPGPRNLHFCNLFQFILRGRERVGCLSNKIVNSGKDSFYNSLRQIISFGLKEEFLQTRWHMVRPRHKVMPLYSMNS